MINLNELARGGTACLSKAGLAEGTNANTIKINAPNGAGVDFAINGLMYHKADTDNIAMTACAVQAAAKACLYLCMLSTAGAVTIIKGTEVASADLTAGTAVLQWPTPTVDTCPFGAFKLISGATSFTVGSQDLTTDIGTGAVTYYDFVTVPVSPLTS